MSYKKDKSEIKEPMEKPLAVKKPVMELWVTQYKKEALMQALAMKLLSVPEFMGHLASIADEDARIREELGQLESGYTD